MLCSEPSEMGSCGWGSGALGKYSWTSNSLWAARGGHKASLTQGQHSWSSASSGMVFPASSRHGQDLPGHRSCKCTSPLSGQEEQAHCRSSTPGQNLFSYLLFPSPAWHETFHQPFPNKCSQLRCCESRSGYNLTPSHSYPGSGVIFKHECYIHLFQCLRSTFCLGYLQKRLL